MGDFMIPFSLAYWIAAIFACLFFVRIILFTLHRIKKNAEDDLASKSILANWRVVAKIIISMPELFDNLLIIVLFVLIGIFGEILFKNVGAPAVFGGAITFYMIIWIYYLGPIRMERLKKVDPVLYSESEDKLNTLKRLRTNKGMLVLLIAAAYFVVTRIMHL
jgi:hypothetical protein